MIEHCRWVNLNDVANALKPVFLVGESIEVRIVKPGESPGQGVGYLDDGTMVVVDNARKKKGKPMALRLSEEIADAYNGAGASVACSWTMTRAMPPASKAAEVSSRRRMRIGKLLREIGE